MPACDEGRAGGRGKKESIFKTTDEGKVTAFLPDFSALFCLILVILVLKVTACLILVL